METIQVTVNQKEWLRHHGGRTAVDVLNDGHGLYVLMQKGNTGEYKVYLPIN